MKLKNSGAIIILLFFFVKTESVAAQGYTISNTDLTINTGYTFPDLKGLEFTSQGSGSNGSGYNPIYLELGYNYSGKGLLSVYFSDASATTGNFYWFDTSSVPHNYYYTVSIVTFGLSSRYYLGNGEKIRPFLGAMIGCYFINLVTNEELPAFGSVLIAHTKAAVAYRAYAGAVYYFSKCIGLDISAGYGNNYYASVGLSFNLRLSQKIYKDQINTPK